ncbi:Eco57I restriction-modification methylase domain-containing protein [Pseudomonas helleri]|uniref:Eco57I restriction-modification methylase domain-containing protein n=1 Tax=Pseudomonas helleri TaxID=1608996 RepID=UPI003FD4F915
MTRQPLEKSLRRSLEATVVKARDIAEQAATQAVKRLCVGDAKPADYLSDEQRKLRTRLRAHGRQQGDSKDANGQQSIHKLVSEVAYEHWHRMLFARFLEQNSLLMYDEHTPLTLAECNELVQDLDVARDELESRCQSGWELAGVLASKMLPQIFRIDSPVFELELAPEHQRSLEQLVIGLALETFQAQDSLGWVYQFWQSKRKEEVNKSEVKIGADELSPVTQLFTEPYMVSFLLDNSLGAWWAGQHLSDSDWQHASSEQELRDKAAIPGVPLSYLRFVKDETTQHWQPASGTFDAWPKQLSELKALDPCCGSGHFLVAAFLMLVPMRMQAENLSAQQAIDRVLSDNLHGLELDQRCVELAAFAVALEAWRYTDAGGYRSLPELHLACSGLVIDSRMRTKILSYAGNSRLANELERIFNVTEPAKIAGSLIDPVSSFSGMDLFADEEAELLRTISEILSLESDYEAVETGILAQGAYAALKLLTEKYHLVLTNFPFLGLERQAPELSGFLKKYHGIAKRDLATSFLHRCKSLSAIGGVTSAVMPGEWTFKPSHRHFREWLISNSWIRFLASIGRDAFSTGLRVTPVMLSVSWGVSKVSPTAFLQLGDIPYEKKANNLLSAPMKLIDRKVWFETPDHRFVEEIQVAVGIRALSEFSDARLGISAGDGIQFERNFWEIPERDSQWEFLQGAVPSDQLHSGCSMIVHWENECGSMFDLAQSVKHLNHSAQNWQRGRPFWSKYGLLVSQMGGVTNYTGQIFDSRTLAIVPNSVADLEPLYAYAFSGELMVQVKKLDDGYKINSPRTFLSVPFDKQFWSGEFKSNFPDGFPKPYTNDPTQWIFHGHPCGSVIWDEETKRTAHGELRVDDSVLQVAVARLLGYRWPAELDADMELAAEQHAWVQRCQQLDAYVDDDGIVCLPAVRGEKAADQRLEALLQAAYGEAWTTPLKNRLLKIVGSKSLSLWLRDKFFEQHCKLFQHRPFIWHIWDGLNDGFSALVNYHKLDKAGLERLIYTYLGDWIRTQQSGMANGEDGAQERLAAAEALKRELEAILEGEKPYDIFVRWKPLAEQPIGWTPNLNDGVRLNIRPFLSARDVGKKGAGILRWMPNIKWAKDRGKDVESAPWYHLGLQYDEGEGARINDHHLSLAEKQKARS